MNTSFRIALVTTLAASLCLPAQAGMLTDQAVCNVRLSPGQLEGLGRSGGLIVATKLSYAECSDFTRSPQVTYFCSTSPTSANCTVETRAHYSEAALMALFAALTEARHQLDTVDIFFEGSGSSLRGQQLRVGID